MSDEVQFGILGPEGLTNVRMIKRSNLAACSHYILVPEHYREDGSCRCDDPDHSEMKEWGYRWNGYLWVCVDTPQGADARPSSLADEA